MALSLLAACQSVSSAPPEDLAIDQEPDLTSYPDNTVWAVQHGGGWFDHADGIAIDKKGSAFVSGDISFRQFTARLGGNGGLSWVLPTACTDTMYDSYVAVASNGDILVTGNFKGTMKLGSLSATSHGGGDVFVARLSNAGKPLWLWSAGGPMDDHSRGVAVDAQGSCLVTGGFNSQGDAGKTATFGGTTLTSKGLEEIFVLKLSPSGKLKWAISAGGPGWDIGDSVETLSDGGAVICGSFSNKAEIGQVTMSAQGEKDPFVARVSPDGKVIWVARGEGPGWNLAHAVAVAEEGAIYVTGVYRDKMRLGSALLASRGSSDVFLVALDAQGSFKWATSAGGPKDDGGYALAVDSRGVHVTGAFEGQARFGKTTLVSRGGEDLFVGSYAHDGTLRWIEQAGGPRVDYGAGIAIYPDGTLGVTGIFRDHAYFGRTRLDSRGYTDAFVWRLRPPLQ